MCVGVSEKEIQIMKTQKNILDIELMAELLIGYRE